MKLKIITTIIILCSTVYAPAQGIRNPNKPNSKPKSIFCQSIVLPSDSKDSLRVSTLVRVAYSSLLFKRVPNTEKNAIGNFYSIIETNVTYKDSENIIKGRVNISDTIYQDNLEDLKLNNSYYVRSLSSTIKTANYSAVVELLDENNREIATIKLADISGNQIDKSEIIMSPIYAYKFEDEYYAAVLDSSLDFRSQTPLIFIPFISKSPTDRIKYEIKCTEKDTKVGFTAGKLFTQNGTAEVIRNSKFDFTNTLGDNTLTIANSEIINLAKIELGKDMLMPGKYLLSASIENSTEKIEKIYSIEYVNQPKSLRNIKIAVPAMSYVMSKEEMANLESADEELKYALIEQFWHKQDPNPKTIFNEALAEYFRRIEYSMENFNTLVNSNGAFTERGKIYTLLGAPDRIEMRPKEEITIEIWYYSNQNKKVVFEISSAGHYSVVEVN